MDISKEELLKNGYVSIGNKGSLEYLAKEGEFGEVLYVPVQEGQAIGIVQSISKEVLRLLTGFVDV